MTTVPVGADAPEPVTHPAPGTAPDPRAPLPPAAIVEPNPDRTSAKFIAASTPPEWLVAEGASVLVEALDLLERAEELARRFDDLDYAGMRIRPKLTYQEGDDAAGQEWSDAVFVWPAMRVLSAAASHLMPIAGHDRPPKSERPSARTLRTELQPEIDRAADLVMPIPFMSTRTDDDTITARRIVLIDDEGRERIVLDTTKLPNDSSASVKVIADNGEAVELLGTKSGADLAFFDPDGNILMQQSTVDEGDGRHLVAMLPGDCMQGPDLEWTRKAGS